MYADALRLAEADAEALRRQADLEGRPMQEVIRRALMEYIESHSRAELLDRVLDSELPVTPKPWSGSENDLPDLG